MPTRLSGIGAGERQQRARRRPAPRLAQHADRLRQRELLAGEAGDEAAAADIAAALEPAIDAQQIAPRRQPGGLAFDEPPEHDAVAAQQRARHVLDRARKPLAPAPRTSPARGRASAQRPASSMPNVAVRRRRRPPASGRRSPDGTSSARKPAEAVGAHEAERDQFRQRLLDLRAQQAGAVDELVEERRAVLANMSRPPPARGLLGWTCVRVGGDSDVQCAACRRASSVIGVVRTGSAGLRRRCADRAGRGRSRVHATCPARQRSSSHVGS